MERVPGGTQRRDPTWNGACGNGLTIWISQPAIRTGRRSWPSRRRWTTRRRNWCGRRRAEGTGRHACCDRGRVDCGAGRHFGVSRITLERRQGAPFETVGGNSGGREGVGAEERTDTGRQDEEDEEDEEDSGVRRVVTHTLKDRIGAGIRPTIRVRIGVELCLFADLCRIVIVVAFVEFSPDVSAASSGISAADSMAMRCRIPVPLPAITGFPVAQGQPFVGVRLVGGVLVVLLEREFYTVGHLFDAEDVAEVAAVGTRRGGARVDDLAVQKLFADAMVADVFQCNERNWCLGLAREVPKGLEGRRARHGHTGKVTKNAPLGGRGCVERPAVDVALGVD